MKRAQQKESTRQELLEAARGLIAARGFAATTAREVAESAGVAVGTVFAHFPTMARLAETLLDETVAKALARAGEGPEGGALLAQLLHVSKALYEAYGEEPALSRQVVAASLFEADPEGPSQRRMAEFAAWVGTRVDAAIGTGQLEPMAQQEAFWLYFALYFGVLVLGLRGELSLSGQTQLLERMLRRTFRPAVQP